MFHRGLPSGGTAAYWERSWARLDLPAMIEASAADPLRPLFTRFALPGRRMLEGGCGLGHYVAYYASQGVKVVGLDFAHQTLASLHRACPDLPLCVGDVGELPFRDGAFDVYYSGGVVEHFESGPGSALREARRVLHEDGVLLISVPYYSPLRRLLAPWRRDWQRLRRPAIQHGDDSEFFQYAFTRSEFERLLRDADLRVVESLPYSVLWGIKEFPGMDWLMKSAHTLRLRLGGAPLAKSLARGSDGTTHDPRVVDLRRRGLLARLLISEDDSVPLLSGAVRVLARACANLMMYVCVPRDHRG
jgi:SAM-dependent methyltransferase